MNFELNCFMDKVNLLQKYLYMYMYTNVYKHKNKGDM